MVLEGFTGAHQADSQEGGGSGEGVKVQSQDECSSVPVGVDVVVEAERGDRGPTELLSVTAPTAAAALDPHDVPEETLTIRAVETEPHRAGDRGGAAAVV